MTGDELRRRIAGMGLPYTETAHLLGLSIGGLHHQLRGERAVSQQTEMLLDHIELIGALARILTPKQKHALGENVRKKLQYYDWQSPRERGK
jgi:hypothetical protein